MANYIVRLKDGERLAQCSKKLFHHKKKFIKMRHLNMIALDADSPDEIITYLDPEHIDEIEEDIQVQLIRDMESDEGAESADHSWGMKEIGAVYRRIPKRYPRPKVAVLDSGLSLHPALRVAKTYANFTSERSPADQNGHGTHIAGIIGASKVQNSSLHGVFPGLPLMSVKVFDRDGSAQISSVIRGIEWCIEQGVQIVNMSFGVNTDFPLLHDTIKAATERGVLFIAASGNDGTPYVSFPARYPEVIAVGSINQSLQPSAFSQYGNSLDLVAPGENIYSTWVKRSYKSLSGTSMACAYVTGVAAIILAAKPKWESSQVRELLLEETRVIEASYLKQGRGMIDLEKIINRLKK